LVLYQALQFALALEGIAELVDVLLVLPGHCGLAVGLQSQT
jgi:hypothetical protein